MKRLLRLPDIEALSVIELANAILLQSRYQFADLLELRFRRPEINNAFARIGERNKFDVGSVQECLSWARMSRDHLSGAYERLASDGLKWGGQLGNNLNAPLSQVCTHSVHGLMCFDLLLSLMDGSSTSSSQGESSNDLSELRFDVKSMLECCVIPDVESLTKEKFGACPQISVQVADRSAPFVLDRAVPPLLSFVMVELLKNSLEAVLTRYGVLDLDDAECGIFVSP